MKERLVAELPKKLKTGTGMAVLFLIILSLLSGTPCMTAGKTGLSSSNLTMSVNQKKHLKLRNSSGKITWKILSGKKNISIKNSGNKAVVVTAKKKGTAVIQAKSSGKNYSCRVTVKNRKSDSGQQTGSRPQDSGGQQEGKRTVEKSDTGQQTPDGKQKKEKAEMRIVIRAGSRSFPAVLYDNEAAAAVWEKLPLVLDMSELNGNEKYYYMDEALPVDASVPANIREGDLMLYGSDCLVLFYKDFSTSYRYTPLGRAENPSGLAEALGTGGVKVMFERMDCE